MLGYDVLRPNRSLSNNHLANVDVIFSVSFTVLTKMYGGMLSTLELH